MYAGNKRVQALSIRQEPFSRRWLARGHVDGVSELEAWGAMLIEAMEALQALAAERGEEQAP